MLDFTKALIVYTALSFGAIALFGCTQKVYWPLDPLSAPGVYIGEPKITPYYPKKEKDEDKITL